MHELLSAGRINQCEASYSYRGLQLWFGSRQHTEHELVFALMDTQPSELIARSIAIIECPIELDLVMVLVRSQIARRSHRCVLAVAASGSI